MVNCNYKTVLTHLHSFVSSELPVFILEVIHILRYVVISKEDTYYDCACDVGECWNRILVIRYRVNMDLADNMVIYLLLQ
jgi:hypothetical protein